VRRKAADFEQLQAEGLVIDDQPQPLFQRRQVGQASCTTSSADCGLSTNDRATRNMAGDH